MVNKPKKISINYDENISKWLVSFNGETIGEFFTPEVAEQFMVGQSCSMIIRDLLGQ